MYADDVWWREDRSGSRTRQDLAVVGGDGFVFDVVVIVVFAVLFIVGVSKGQKTINQY